jgi:hypothetical protein
MVSSFERRTFLTAAALALAAGAFSCNGVLGISEAALDPTLATPATGPQDAAVETGAPADPNSCRGYCEAVAQTCKDTNQEYTSVETCVAMCQNFEPGTPGEQANDSLACRVSHIHQTGTATPTLCRQGGPLASGSCAKDPCAAFCTLAFDLCQPINIIPFKDVAECRAQCSTWPYLTADDTDAGSVGDILFADGNTLNCRLYHLESAYEVGNPTAATTHCRHVGNISATCQ